MRSSRVAASLIVAGLLLLLAATPAAASAVAPGERIANFDSAIVVNADGSLAITETIQYSFGGDLRHGIFRNVPIRESADPTHDRLYPLEHVFVLMDGAGVHVSLSTQGADEVIKIGDPNQTITGVHTYRISYTMRGATNTFPDHDELYWNAVGTGWPVPIDSVTVTVSGPAAPQRTACFAGPAGSHLSCASQGLGAGKATFSQLYLNPHDGLSIVVAYPKGSVAGTGAILVDHPETNWFAPKPAAVVAGAVLALLGIAAALYIGWRDGRDRVYLGQLPGLTPGPGESAAQKRKPLWHPPPVSVEFTPPEGVRPGQVGTLIDERVNVVDVTATIVDFAVRRHIAIRELPEAKPLDWEITKLTKGDPKFRPYERRLFWALFRESDTVRVSELKGVFVGELHKAEKALYDEVVARGWFRASPERTRAKARRTGWLALLGALIVTFVLGATVHMGLIGLGLVVAALCLVFVAGYAPARTGAGSAMLARVMGFRLFIATAQAEQLKFEERAQIFSDYLPFAMVFGLADRWTSIFADLASTGLQKMPRLYWYTGAGVWNANAFSAGIGSLTSMTSGTLVSTPSAAGISGFGGSGFSGGGGGFSGGGGGGGGGGSW